MSDNPTLVEDTYRTAYGNLMLHLIEGLAPYLTHYSVLASALRAQRKLQPFVCRDLMASEKWRAYETHLEDLREVKCQFDKAAGCICDSALCPNLHKHTTCRWRRCSGCAVFYYCSRDCQKQDWKARHRGQCASIRNDFNTNIRALSSQDRFFLEYDCRMVIQSYMQHNHALVRHIDYTTTPLTVNLRPLENYIGEDNYSHVAEVVRRKEGVAVVTVHSVGSMTTTTSIPRKSTLTCYEYSTLSKPLRYSREIRCL
ncbi:hypothetical protein BDZ89DRAFT_397801 [Hymenopellis radicata]|nr:hypothetical protein BDZ89DRAFT_397801 [Hymenopellis radicata]